MRPPSGERLGPPGFSLVETLVALTLLGMALLMTLSLLWQEPWVLRRLAAHESALRVLESTLESIRAGADLPPAGTALPLDMPAGSAAEPMVLLAEVEAATPPGLFRLRLVARYKVGGGNFERSLETFVWRPPP